MNDILLVGGGGHCRSCIDVIEATGDFKVIGVIKPQSALGEMVYDYPVLGDDDILPDLLTITPRALVAVGQISSAFHRKRLFSLLRTYGANLPIVISPFAKVSPRASIGHGTIVMHGAILNAGSQVGENGIINSRALIEHGTKIGNHCHVSTGVIINGDCVVADECFIGSGTVVHEGVTIGSGAVIGAGSVIKKNLPAGCFIRSTREPAISEDFPRESNDQKEALL